MSRSETANPNPNPDASAATATAPLPGWLAGLLVFLTSAAVLVLEITGLRLVAPYVGLTLQVSTAVIGAALAAIAFGAWTGGLVADRSSPRHLLGPLLLLAGLATLLVVPIVRVVGAVLTGSGTSAVLLLALATIFVPAALLSAVAPLVVKLQLSSLAHTGAVVGRFSGLGTLGAILASFLTGFVLLTAFSTTAILRGLGITLVALGIGVSMALRRQAGTPAAAVGAVAALTAVLLGAAVPERCDEETAYHCVSVVADPQRATGRFLVMDRLMHSYVDLQNPTYLHFEYTKAFAAVADAIDAEAPAVLHVGGGGMTLARYLLATRPGSANTVHEIDPGVLEVDRTRLELPTGPGLTVQAVDARIGVREAAPNSLDLVLGDAFGGVSVPWHLTTVEFLVEVDRVLHPGGIYAANVIDYGPKSFARAQVATLREVWPNVAIIEPSLSPEEAGGGNFVLLASRAPLPLEEIAATLARHGGTMRVATEQAARGFAAGAPVLRDDAAPVDQLLTTAPG